MFNFDKAIDFYSTALKLHSQRSDVIANNLVNVDTPGFKAQDINFQEAIKQYSGESLTMAGDNHKHITIKNDPFGMVSLPYLQASTIDLNGNTVDKDVETVA